MSEASGQAQFLTRRTTPPLRPVAGNLAPDSIIGVGGFAPGHTSARPIWTIDDISGGPKADQAGRGAPSGDTPGPGGRVCSLPASVPLAILTVPLTRGARSLVPAAAASGEQQQQIGMRRVM